MLNSQNLINKICAKIDCGGLTSLETCQTTGALNILSNLVVSVATFSDLPDPLTYYGRIIYVLDENRYYYAVYNQWLNSLDSKPLRYSDETWAWGSNFFNGELGDNSSLDRSSPVSVVGGFTDWCQASAGGSHSLGLRTNGTLWAWGCNGNGRLGDNTGRPTIRSPVSVVGGFSDWCEASAGFSHSLAVRSNGILWAWGSNANGRLGDNTITSRSSPVSVVGGFSDWCEASAGGGHSLAVRTNGTLWAWGCNNYAQLGDNTITSRSSPVSVVGGFSDWCEASAGSSHSLAVRTNGTLWAWGSNNRGQIGDNTITNRSSPVSVVGGFTDWCQASAGESHSLAVRSNGTLWAWGCNTTGQLGDNSITSRRSPVSVVGGFSDWCQASAGGFHSLAVRTNGTAWAWGFNTSGQLGDNTVTSRRSPVSVVGGFSDWCQASAGGSHSMAVVSRIKGF
jgi:alpha-tubulin suppressor-like RCC1 family protein